MAKNLVISHISNKTYSAIIKKNGEIFISHFPFNKIKPAEKVSADKKVIARVSESDLASYLLSTYYLNIFSDAHNLFTRINNGSSVIESAYEFKEKILETISNNTYLLSGDGKVTVSNWLIIAFTISDYEHEEVDDIKEAIESAGFDSNFVTKIHQRFGATPAREALNDYLTKYLPELKKKGLWSLLKSAAYICHFISSNYHKERMNETSSEISFTNSMYENVTGKDASHKSFQRYSNRKSKNDFYEERRRKLNKNKSEQ